MNSMTSAAAIDAITPRANGGGFVGSGTVALQLLQSGFNVNSLRVEGILRKDEWKMLDDKVVEIARSRLRLANDLVQRGLTMGLPNAMGTTRLEWERISDIGGASINMSGLNQTLNDRPEWDLVGMPIPIIHKDFQINLRHLEASRNRGMPLDTTMLELATRKVADSVETLILSGGFSQGANGTIYGYTNYTDRNTGSVTASWKTTTGANILTDVLAMVKAANADYMFGPFVLYVPQETYVHMAEDYKAESDKTILQRVLEVPSISAVLPSDTMTGSGGVLVQMTSDVIQLIDGIQPTVVQWESQGGMVQNFKVMAIMLPRIKSDQDGRCGIVHYS